MLHTSAPITFLHTMDITANVDELVLWLNQIF